MKTPNNHQVSIPHRYDLKMINALIRALKELGGRLPVLRLPLRLASY